MAGTSRAAKDAARWLTVAWLAIMIGMIVTNTHKRHPGWTTVVGLGTLVAFWSIHGSIARRHG